MTDRYSEYHEHLRATERWTDNRNPVSRYLYEADLNLKEELTGVPNGSIIVDVGCCAGEGTAALKHNPNFCNLAIVGITPTIVQRGGGKSVEMPIYQGAAENLSTVLQQCGRFPADVLLMRNVMEEICVGENTCNASGITLDVFTEAYKSLALNGKLLIYDQFGKGRMGTKFYEKYTNLGQAVGFTVQELNCPPRQVFQNERVCPTYLRLTKGAPSRRGS